MPTEFVAKLFTKLQKAGLVVAAEGARGGFRLARKPEAISVLDVIVAIDGAKPLFACREIRERCAVLRDLELRSAPWEVCAIHAIMLEAQGRMRAALAAHTLAEIATTVAAKVPSDYLDAITQWLATRAAKPQRILPGDSLTSRKKRR